ncbi:hypothetical protein B0H14DRAFT_3161303 [Mycena olivaceomarginata]|nr:hypothetical protein B0H14DRAFT_3161303 [Mycena olivaceomarginata]
MKKFKDFFRFFSLHPVSRLLCLFSLHLAVSCCVFVSAMDNRYHPYHAQFRRKRPILHFPPAQLSNAHHRPVPYDTSGFSAEDTLFDAYDRLRQLNVEQGLLCTFDHSTSSWVEVTRPQNVRHRKARPVAASGLDRIWGKYTSPFFCPHHRRSGQSYDPLVLSLGARHEGGLADIYRALDHICSFIIVVPPINPRITLITAEDQRRFQAEQERHDDHDEEDTPPPEPSTGSSQASSSAHAHATGSQASSSSFGRSPTTLSSIGYPPGSSQTSLASSASGRSPRPIETLAAEILLHPDPRYTGPRSMSTGRRAPIPIGEGSGRTVRAYYRLDVADARKQSNIDLMAYIQEITAFCSVNDDPTLHPAWDPDAPPIPLRLYDERLYANCQDATNTHLHFLYKPLGQAIRDMNTVLGIPYRDYATFVRSSQVCVGCMNHFSPDGYEHHRRDGLCTNHPDLVPVDACAPFEATIRFRSFCAKRPEFQGETLNSAVGTALLQWNSRLGVPTDVWITASTAVVHCTSCDLTRTFPAHLLHLDGGDCSDPGQAVVSADGFDTD